jgi:protein BCP1
VKVSNGNKSFQKELAKLLDESSNGDVGLVLSERIINMPAAITPPSYNMLLEEIQWAHEDVFHLLSTF